jgi:hypothetical protein
VGITVNDEEHVGSLQQVDLQLDAPIIRSDPAAALLVLDRLGGVHDMKRVSLPDPVLARRAGEPDRLHPNIIPCSIWIMQGTTHLLAGPLS